MNSSDQINSHCWALREKVNNRLRISRGEEYFIGKKRPAHVRAGHKVIQIIGLLDDDTLSYVAIISDHIQ